MVEDKKKRSNWRDKFRFSIYNDSTFEEVWRITLSRYAGIVTLSSIVFFIIAATASLIFFTGLREFIPGYPDVQMRRNILMNAILLDSLENELALRDSYFYNLNTIILGKEPPDRLAGIDTSLAKGSVTFRKSADDSLLRQQVESEEQYSLSIVPSGTLPNTSLANIHFFPPVKGIVSGKYERRSRHYGTDVVTGPKAVVSATLDGTVIFSGWTLETGFVLHIQHANNLISVYKHNSNLFKETGDLVKAGEAIAVVGSSGELYTSGPHLHFEIWFRGEPMDPQQYILF